MPLTSPNALHQKKFVLRQPNATLGQACPIFSDAKETRPLTLLDVRLTQQITRPKSMGRPKTLVGPSVLGSSMGRSAGATKSMTARALRAYRSCGKGG